MERKRKKTPSEVTLATRLKAERRAIQRRLAALDEETPGRNPNGIIGDNTPTSEVMEAVQESVAAEVTLASREALTARLRALVRAEEKVRQGKYGRCEICGKPIPAARLDAIPEATQCVPCAEEKAGAAPPR